MKELSTNPFKDSEYNVKWYKLPLYLAWAVLSSQLVMYLDDALIVAYVLCPYVFIQMWASDSGIKWSNNKQHFSIYVCSSAAFLVVATLFILEVLSFEKSGKHSLDVNILNNAVESIANQNKK